MRAKIINNVSKRVKVNSLLISVVGRIIINLLKVDTVFFAFEVIFFFSGVEDRFSHDFRPYSHDFSVA